MSDESKVYYSSFFVLWRWATIFCTLLGGFFYGLAWLTGDPLPLLPTAQMTLGLGLVFALAILISPVTVKPEGIRGYDFFGRYSLLPYEEMVQTKNYNLIGLKYVIVSNESNSKVLYIPLYLGKMQDFREMVLYYAEEGNPLAKFLQK